MRVIQPGCYTMPLMDYVRDPAPQPSLSASVAHAMLTQSPLHAYLKHPRLNTAWANESASRMDIGTVAHAILLEGKRDGIVIVEADDWRTKAAKEARDQAREAGKIPVLRDQMGEIEAMVEAAQKAIAQSELASVWADGVAEQSLVWQEGAIWCRCRPDWMSADKRVLIDYKTTAGTAEPTAWSRGPLNGNGYDLQAALMVRGAQILFQPQDVTAVFMVQECSAPYAVSFVSLTPAYVEHAQRKLAQARGQWVSCLAKNEWPGYPSQVAYMDAPAWEIMWFEEVMG